MAMLNPFGTHFAVWLMSSLIELLSGSPYGEVVTVTTFTKSACKSIANLHLLLQR